MKKEPFSRQAQAPLRVRLLKKLRTFFSTFIQKRTEPSIRALSNPRIIISDNSELICAHIEDDRGRVIHPPIFSKKKAYDIMLGLLTLGLITKEQYKNMSLTLKATLVLPPRDSRDETGLGALYDSSLEKRSAL